MSKKRKINRKFLVKTIKLSLITYLIMAYLLGYIASLGDRYEQNMLAGIFYIADELIRFHIWYPVTASSLIMYFISFLVVCVMSVIFYIDLKTHESEEAETAKGSGRYMNEEEIQEYNQKHLAKTEEEIEKYREEYIAPCDVGITRGDEAICLDDFDTMILSKTFRRHMIAKKTTGNNNVLIVGGAGSGKSFNNVKPNLGQMNASFVVTDPSGELLAEWGTALVNHGYKVKVFNTEDMSTSMCYNPFYYARDEASVISMVNCFIDNTTTGEGGGDNQFFVDAEKLIYSACIFYLKEFCQNEDEMTFHSVLKMTLAYKADETGKNTDKTPLEELFESLPHSSMAYQNYDAYVHAPGKTRMSIVISALVRMQRFMIEQVQNITQRDEMELDKMGDEKIALFIIPSQTTRTFDFLNSMLYCQLFETLYHIGNERKKKGGSESLKIPVRCILDEFANIGTIPEFPSRLSTMRKYNISCTIILQDLSQISQKLYEKDWRELVSNCSTHIFLAGMDQETLEWFSKRLGNKTIRVEQQSSSGNQLVGNNASRSYSVDSKEVMSAEELSRLDQNHCLIMTQGMRPVYDEKYLLIKHPRFSQTASADPNNTFLYATMAAYNNGKSDGLTTLVRARRDAEASILEEELLQKTGAGKICYHTESAESKDVYDLADEITVDKKVEEKSLEQCEDNCLNEAVMNLDPEGRACIFKLDNVPVKFLNQLAKTVAEQLNQETIILFTYIKTQDESKDKMVGLVYDQAGILSDPVINNEYALNVRRDDERVLVDIKPERYEIYKEKVLNAAA